MLKHFCFLILLCGLAIPQVFAANTPPTITQGDIVPRTIDEENSPSSFGMMALNVSDPDVADTFTWNITVTPNYGIANLSSSTGTAIFLDYTPNSAYFGSDTLSVEVRDAYGATDVIVIPITINPRNDAPVNTILPIISGEFYTGETVSVSTGTWNDNNDDPGSLPPGSVFTYTYRWFSDGSVIPGETNNTYQIRDSDFGKTISAEVTATDDGVGLPAAVSSVANSSPSTTIAQNALGLLADQYAALIDFYDALNGASWIDNANWTSASAAGWTGLTVNAGYVTGLVMSNNNLDGTLPDSFSHLLKIQNLILSNNKIRGELPAGITSFGDLIVFDFRDNMLSGSIPEFTSASQPVLTTIQLDSNTFTGSLPDSYITLNPSVLSFSYNAITVSDTVRAWLLAQDFIGQLDTQTIAPDNIVISAPRYLDASWTPITYTSDTGRYSIGISTTSGGPYTFVQSTANKTDNNLSYTGVTTGQNYYVVIRAETDAHGSNQNNVISDHSFEQSITIPVVPTPVITAPSSASLFPMQFSINFDSDVTGFTQSDLNVTNGTIANFGGSGSSYTVGITPSAIGLVSVDIPVDVVNEFNNSATANITFAPVAPVISINSAATTTNTSPEFTISIDQINTTTLALPSLSINTGRIDNIIGSGQNYTVQCSGVLEGTVTLSIISDAIRNAYSQANVATSLDITVREAFSADAPFHADGATISYGSTIPLLLTDGLGPYSISASGCVVVSSNFDNSGLHDYDNDTDNDHAQVAAVTFLGNGGNRSITITDTAGTEQTLNFIVNIPTASTLTTPSITVSGAQTIYTPISPSTPEGMSAYNNLFEQFLSTEARAGGWNASSQTFFELPQDAALPPYQGLFVAARAPLTQSISGSALSNPTVIPLMPGWNFIGFPPINDGSLVTSFTFAGIHLYDTTGVEITGATRDMLIGTSAKYWNGSAYVDETNLDTGKGYWIQNSSTNPEGILFLSNITMSLADHISTDEVIANTRSGHIAYESKDLGDPPPPVNAASRAAQAEEKGCGIGGIVGIALALISIALSGLSLQQKSFLTKKPQRKD